MTHDHTPRGASAGWVSGDADLAGRLASVRTRRVLAFLIDYGLVGAIWLAAVVPVFVLGLLTLGLGFLLYPILGVAIALIYVGSTLSGPMQATWGMRFFSLRIERLDGAAMDFITAIVHAVIFWVTLSFPLLLLISLFNAKKQLLQDIILGTVVVRTDH